MAIYESYSIIDLYRLVSFKTLGYFLIVFKIYDMQGFSVHFLNSYLIFEIKIKLKIFIKNMVGAEGLEPSILRL